MDYIGSSNPLTNSHRTDATGNAKGRSIDLSGTSAGSIYQEVLLKEGQQYELTFSLAGNPNDSAEIKTLDVNISNPLNLNQTLTFDAMGATRDAMEWVTESLLFTAVSGVGETLYRFTFASCTNTAFGPALDNVSLTAVPLPAAAWLFISALGGLALIGRRRRMHGATA